jgi:hypothetical protein
MRTDDLVSQLIYQSPEAWARSGKRSDLTPQRLGRMLAGSYKINSVRQTTGDRLRRLSTGPTLRLSLRGWASTSDRPPFHGNRTNRTNRTSVGRFDRFGGSSAQSDTPTRGDGSPREPSQARPASGRPTPPPEIPPTRFQGRSMSAVRAPAGLTTAGRKLWNAVSAGYDLTPSERVVLAEAYRTADELARLERAVAELPELTTTGSVGQPTSTRCSTRFAGTEKSSTVCVVR